MSSTKEITESLGFGVIFAALKADIDYSSEKKVTLYSAGKNTAIAASTDLVYDFVKNQKYWPWI